MQQEFSLTGDMPEEATIALSLFKMNGGPRKQIPLVYAEGKAVKTVWVHVNGARRYDTHGRISIELEGVTANRLPFRASVNYANPERSGIIFDPKV